MKTKHIVFIHGLFVNPKSWIQWKAFFESKGFTCHTPANPYHSGEPSELREHFNPLLGKVTLEEEVNNIIGVIDNLPEKPILIGHSLGGLVVQKLLSLDKAIAGVCIDGVPPKGIFTLKWSFWESNFPVLNYFKGDTVFEPNKEWFHYAFAHLMKREESDLVFDELVVPESRNVPRGTLGDYAAVDFNKPHHPLLFIAGEMDHIVPAALNLENFHAYTDPSSIKEYVEFQGRTHYICGMTGWEEVADFTLNWIEKL